jgi:hypothetical protein
MYIIIDNFGWPLTMLNVDVIYIVRVSSEYLDTASSLHTGNLEHQGFIPWIEIDNKRTDRPTGVRHRGPKVARLLHGSVIYDEQCGSCPAIAARK